MDRCISVLVSSMGDIGIGEMCRYFRYYWISYDLCFWGNLNRKFFLTVLNIKTIKFYLYNVNFWIWKYSLRKEIFKQKTNFKTHCSIAKFSPDKPFINFCMMRDKLEYMSNCLQQDWICMVRDIIVCNPQIRWSLFQWLGMKTSPDWSRFIARTGGIETKHLN